MDKRQKGSSREEMMKKEKKDEGLGEEGGPGRGVCRFPLLVAILQLLLGAAVIAVAFLTLAISPSLTARETPHWAGIIVSVFFFFSLHRVGRLCMSICQLVVDHRLTLHATARPPPRTVRSGSRQSQVVMLD